MHENEPGSGAPSDGGARRLTYRCTDCEHWFSSHGDAGCKRTDETNERCPCTRTKEMLFGSYGPPFPPLTVRGRYARHLRRYRVRNDPWQVAMRPVFALLRARRQDGRPLIPPWPPLIG